MNALQLCRRQFSHKETLCENFLQTFFKRRAILDWNRPFCVFDPPLGGGLRDNVRYSSLAHWKARSGLSISVNWTFFARCYGWAATSERRSNIGDFAL